MKFFIPNAKDEIQAKEILEGIIKFNKENIGEISNRKIYSITYKHNNKKYIATVGEVDELENETIIAILESLTFLVCTRNRGVVRGIPILVGQEEVITVTDFES